MVVSKTTNDSTLGCCFEVFDKAIGFKAVSRIITNSLPGRDFQGGNSRELLADCLLLDES